MSKKNGLMMIGVIALVAIVVAVSLLWRGGASKLPAVALPTAQAPGTGETYTVYGRAEVTPETVQAVIATLDRAEAYSRSVTVEDIWQGGSSSLVIRQWQTTGGTRLRVERKNNAENILFTGGNKYIWYDNLAGVYAYPSAGGNKEADRYLRCLTYEDALSLPAEDILAAGYSEYAGESCCWFQYRTEPFGYRETLYVSVNTGVLMGAESRDGETLIYRMTSDAVDVTPPDSSWFELPVGTEEQ